jgi:hypothetical protein
MIYMNFEEGNLNKQLITNKVMNPFVNLIYMNCNIKCPIFKKYFIWSIQQLDCDSIPIYWINGLL